MELDNGEQNLDHREVANAADEPSMSMSMSMSMSISFGGEGGDKVVSGGAFTQGGGLSASVAAEPTPSKPGRVSRGRKSAASSSAVGALTYDYRVPTLEESSGALGSALIGSRVSIFWDGDNVYYPARIVKYELVEQVADQANTAGGDGDEEAEGMQTETDPVLAYKVVYEGDESLSETVEYLTNNTTVWKIFSKNDLLKTRWDPVVDGESIINSEVDLSRQSLAEAEGATKPRSSKPRATRPKKDAAGGEGKEPKEPRGSAKMTFQQMVLQAVTVLDEKGGSTLQAIRKYIQINFDANLKKGLSVTAFNSMSLKAIQKCMSAEELENPKGHHYKVHPKEKKRRLDAIKEAERRANGYYDKVYYEKGEKEQSYHRVGHLNGVMSLAIFETNKTLGKQKETLKNKRDNHLLRNFNTLRPFLNERNYFWKREMRSIRDSETAVAAAGARSGSSNSINSNDDGTGINNDYGDSNGDDMDNISMAIENNGADDSSSQLSPHSAAMANATEEGATSAGGSMDAIATSNVKSEEDRRLDRPKRVIDPKKNPLSVVDPSSELMRAGDAKGEVDPLDGVKLLKAQDFPTTLTAKLLPHQLVGISYMLHQCSRGMPVLLGDQMGLGKTLQTIGFITMWMENFKPKGPFLIISPLSVLSNWQNEFARFNPSIRCVRFHGVKAERLRLKAEELADKAEFDVVLTSYEVLVSEIMFFRRKCVWTAVIIDEAHRLKNNSSQFSSKLLLVPCLHKILLTGTPLQNNLKELWALLHFMSPDIFSNDTAENFENAFDLLRNKFDHSLMLKAHQLLRLFMLRRIKEDVNLMLPSKKEVTLLVPLTDEQILWYRTLLSDNMDENIIEVIMNEDSSSPSASSAAGGGSGGGSRSSSSSALTTGGSSGAEGSNADWRKLMNLLLQLRKVCNHTSLMPVGDDDGSDDETDDKAVKTKEQVLKELLQGSGKMVMLDRILFRLKDNNHKVLIFSQFTSMLDVLEDYCDCKGYNYVRLDGNTNRVQRRLNCRRFNAINSSGSNIFIFLISTRAGGLGLNLTAADTVILYDSDWNPQVDLQAMERCHRIGQTRPVRIYRLICRGSVEERMVSRASKKLFLNQVVAENPVNSLIGNNYKQSSSISRTSSASTLNSEGEAVMNVEGDKSSKSGSKESKKGAKDADTSKDIDEEVEDYGDVDGADGVEDEDEDEDDDDNSGMVKQAPIAAEEEPTLPSVENDNAIENALGIGANANISKQELFSLIRFGTNAIIDNYDALTDKELDKFLEIRGRDLPSEPELPGEVIAASESAQELKEVDLRQLGGSLFVKKKASNKMVGAVSEKNIVTSNAEGNWADESAPPSKRVRVERIVYVDGKGTGYGGDIPMLKANMSLMEDEEAVVSVNKSKLRRKNWINQDFCCVCGLCPKEKPAQLPASSASSASVPPPVDGGAVFACGYCPKVYHWNCLEQTGILNGYNMHITFSCPHHRCSVCNRTTATAGGMLFRCYDCMTALCEDCLEPYYDLDNFEFNNSSSSTGDSDCYTGGLDMESMGRFSALERLGYKSSQAFYIRCTKCSESNAVLTNQAMMSTSSSSTSSSSSSSSSSPLKSKKAAESNVADMLGVASDVMAVTTSSDPQLDGEEALQQTPVLLSQLVKVYNAAKIIAPPESKGKKRNIKAAKASENEIEEVELFKNLLKKKSDFVSTLHQVLTEVVQLLPELLDHASPLLPAGFPALLISSNSGYQGRGMLAAQTVLQKQSVSSFTFMLSAIVTKIGSGRIRGVQNFVSDVANLLKGIRDILNKELKNRQKLLKDSIESQNRNLETSSRKDISFIESRSTSLSRLLVELEEKSENIMV